MDSTDRGKPSQQRAVSFGERQRSPLDSENLSLRNIPIFRIQQRRRRIPLAPPPLFPVLSYPLRLPTAAPIRGRPPASAAEGTGMDSTDKGKPSVAASGVIRSGSDRLWIRKISAYATFLFSEFNSDGEGTACATTADISVLSHPLHLPTAAPIQVAATLPAEMTGMDSTDKGKYLGRRLWESFVTS